MSEISPANSGSDLIVSQVCKSCRALWQRSALLGVSTACNNTENSSCVISLISCHWPGLPGLSWNTKLWQAVMTREVMTICIWSCILVWNIFSVLTSEIFPTLALLNICLVMTVYSTGNERQTPTGGTISEQIYLGFTKNKHSTDVLSPRAIAHKLFSFQLLKRGPWKKVVHPPSTTFPPLSFDKKFHPLYIDFMLKYFQNQNIFTIVNFNWESLILKIFQHKVYIKGMKFLVKAQWRKSCWGDMYYLFPGALIS